MSDLIVSNRYIDSLIDYVLDVKPYHTKLSEIVEEYLFEENCNVDVTDTMVSMVALGADYLNKSNDPTLQVWQNTTVRPTSTLNANKVIYSDGNRKVFPVPTVYAHKLFSDSQTETHIATNNPSEVAGLNGKVFDARRHRGIKSVTRNNIALIKDTDYFVSRGAFSFTTTGTTWKSVVGESVSTSGNIAYADVSLGHGKIVNITCAASNATYEEWTLTWIAASSHLTVVGSSSGLIGTATFGVPFVHAKINFTFTSFDAVLPANIQNGDTFVLTPSSRVSIHTTAVNQTWTLINVGSTYMVYGSVSGWMTQATVGQFYDNGQIAFKIPKLEFFVTNDGDFTQLFRGQFTSNAPITDDAIPGVYEIIFRTATEATVRHNVWGYQKGLKVGEPFEGIFVNFTINGSFNPGDRCLVYLAPPGLFAISSFYDEFLYDEATYDADLATKKYPIDLLQEWFPLYFLKHAIIIPAAVASDVIKIDKGEREFVRLKIGGILPYNLGADAEGWVPLEYRFDDPFPDHPEKIEAYLAASKYTKVFEIKQDPGVQPTITFDTTFFNTYLTSGTEITLQFHQRSSYAHVADVKFSEFLEIKSYHTVNGLEVVRTIAHIHPPVQP